MADEFYTAAGNEGQPLPDCPELALFIASLFQTLGGWFIINSDGRRTAWRPEPYLFRDRGEGLPQLPAAKPWHQFHSDDEWRGALKVAEYWLTRLSEVDKNFVFVLLAPTAVDPKGFDFRERLQ